MTSVGPATGPEARLRFRVSGMDCAGCAQSVEQAVAAMPEAESARVNFGAATLTVVPGAGAMPPEEIAATVARAGYHAVPDVGRRGAGLDHAPWWRDARLRWVLLAAALWVAGSILSFVSGSPAGHSHATGDGLVGGLFTAWLAGFREPATVVFAGAIVLGGWPFARGVAVGAGAAARHERVDDRLGAGGGAARRVGRGGGGGRPLRARRGVAGAHAGADARGDSWPDGAVAGDGGPHRGWDRNAGSRRGAADRRSGAGAAAGGRPRGGGILGGRPEPDHRRVDPGRQGGGGRVLRWDGERAGSADGARHARGVRFDLGPRHPSGGRGAGEQGPGAAAGRPLRRDLHAGGHHGGVGVGGGRRAADGRSPHVGLPRADAAGDRLPLRAGDLDAGGDRVGHRGGDAAGHPGQGGRGAGDGRDGEGRRHRQSVSPWARPGRTWRWSRPTSP